MCATILATLVFRLEQSQARLWRGNYHAEGRDCEAWQVCRRWRGLTLRSRHRSQEVDLSLSMDGKARGGVGGVDAVTLAEARDKADELRSLVAKGVDPTWSRKEDKGVPTFGQAADEAHVPRKDPNGATPSIGLVWKMTLTKYAAAAAVNVGRSGRYCGGSRGAEASLADQPETASRLRGRIRARSRRRARQGSSRRR